MRIHHAVERQGWGIKLQSRSLYVSLNFANLTSNINTKKKKKESADLIIGAYDKSGKQLNAMGKKFLVKLQVASPLKRGVLGLQAEIGSAVSVSLLTWTELVG